MARLVTALGSPAYAGGVPDDRRFDVQRQSPFTPEGQIESVGHFARGLGGERLRRWVAIGFAGFLVIVAFLVIAELAS